jgi:hypothetical protein
MAYDSTDLTNVNAAITRLLSGDQIVRITRDGRTTEYTTASLGELDALRTKIQNEVNTPATSTTIENPRTALMQTRKGL